MIFWGQFSLNAKIKEVLALRQLDNRMENSEFSQA